MLKLTCSLEAAVKSFTGIDTRPKLMVPEAIARAAMGNFSGGKRMLTRGIATRKSSAQEPEPSSADPLEDYRRKRDPLRTNEPFGPERKDSGRATRHGRFVCHLHDATRRHYDLRLQIGGT